MEPDKPEAGTALSGAELARAFGITEAGVSLMLKRHGRPKLTSIEQALAWRAAHCPARAKRRPSEQQAAPTPPPATTPPAKGKEIDLTIPDGDTDDQAIAMGARMLAMAYQDAITSTTFDRKQAIMNWQQTAKAERETRKEATAAKIEARELIEVDEAIRLVSGLLQAVRRRLLRLSAKSALEANPADPGLAKEIIDREVHAILREVSGYDLQAELKLQEGDKGEPTQ